MLARTSDSRKRQPVEGWGVTRETAMLVLASTPAGTGNVSSDLRACMERHNVATLTRLALERQVALCPPGKNRRIRGRFSSRAWKLSSAPLLSSSGALPPRAARLARWQPRNLHIPALCMSPPVTEESSTLLRFAPPALRGPSRTR